MAFPKVALITGSAHRLGSYFALHLARQGWDIALHYHSSEEKAKQLQKKIESLGRIARLYSYDLSSDLCFDTVIKELRQDFPYLSLLINNASVYEAGTILESSPTVLDRNFAVNIKAPFLLMQSFAKHLGRNVAANIINILDNKIAFAQYEYAAYLLSKKALAELTVMAALEFAPNIRVNAIAPGVILPQSSRNPEYLRWRLEAIPLKKQGSVTSLCKTIDYILECDFITGQILYVDGGEGVSMTGRNFKSFS